MAYAKTGKPARIPIGDEYLPDISEAELEEMVAAIPSCKKIHKKLLILTTALKRKRRGSISGIVGDMGRPYAAVYDYLLRVHGRGLDGRADGVAPIGRGSWAG